MDVYLVDGTYELFRHYYAVPGATDADGNEIGAVRGVLNSILSLLEKGVTHIGVATDHVIESFRNDLYPHYKTGEGIPEDLWSQFNLLEEALGSMGVLVWAMVEFEADDALAAAAVKAAKEKSVDTVIICTPDKDLSQCVVGDKIVQLDRRKNEIRNAQGVVTKFGVRAESIPDYLALVGDTSDGYPGLPGWGAKGAASVLSIYPHLEDIPKDPKEWNASIRGSAKLATTLYGSWDEALLFRKLATLRTDAPVFDKIDELEWRGQTASFEAMCSRLKAPNLFKKTAAVPRRGSPI
ncbi:MAG: flap endonuclease [Candidatus Melainabacteria bacterium]|nr:MAG: flap endonuclease [Candidatus Melainabacteria bacterium]